MMKTKLPLIFALASASAFAGVRYSDRSTDIAITGAATTLSADGSKYWVDPLIGLSYRF